MPVMTQGNLPKDLFVEGLHDVFNAEGADESPLFRSLFHVNTSSKRYEEERSVFGLGLFDEKLELGVIGEDQYGAGYLTRFVHRRFAKGIRLSHELMINDMYDTWKRTVASLKRLAMATQERDAFTVFNNAFTVNWNATAAVPLISTDHLLADGTTKNPNRLAIDADFSIESLIAMKSLIGNWTNMRGINTSLTPMTLLGSNEMEYVFKPVLASTDRPDTADRSINPVYNDLPYKTSKQIDDTDAWFVLCKEHRLLWWDREGIESGDEAIPGTGGAKGDKFFFSTYMASWGASDPIGIFGTSGAG